MSQACTVFHQKKNMSGDGCPCWALGGSVLEPEGKEIQKEKNLTPHVTVDLDYIKV